MKDERPKTELKFDVMREKRKYPVSASQILMGAVRRSKFHDRMIVYRISTKWVDVVGPTVAMHVLPAQWQRGKLIIRAEDPSWMQEMSFLKSHLVERLKQVFPDIPIKSLRFELGELPSYPSQMSPRLSQIVPRNVSAEEMEFIEQSVGQIPDPGVREAARRAMVMGFGR